MYNFIPHDPNSLLHPGHICSHKIGLAFELRGLQGRTAKLSSAFSPKIQAQPAR